MKFEYWYDGYNFKLKAKELTRKQLEKLTDFLIEMRDPCPHGTLEGRVYCLKCQEEEEERRKK